MNQTITIEEESDANFVVDKIRDGTLQGENKEAAFAALAEFRKQTPVVDTSTASKGFGERMSEDFEARKSLGIEIAMATANGEQNFAQGMLQVAGNVGFGTAWDFLEQVMVSGGRGISAITPDAIEDPVKGGAAAAGILYLQSAGGQLGMKALEKGVTEYRDFAVQNPVGARNIEAIVNIGMLLDPVKATRSARGLVGQAGQKIRRSGLESTRRIKKEFAEDLVTPEQTKKIRTEQALRTGEESGVIRQSDVRITPGQAESAAEVAKLRINPNRSLQYNLNVIREASTRKAEALKQRLRHTGKAGRYDRDEFYAELDRVLLHLEETSPVLVGNASLSAEKIIREMKRRVAESKDHLSDLLQVRKDFDTWVVDQGREQLFDPNVQNGLSAAISDIRQATNSFIDARVPSVGVRESLRAQFALNRVVDTLKVRAQGEANNAVLRTMKKAVKVLTIRGELNQTAALLFGVGGMGAAAMFAPYITALGGLTAATYVGSRLVMAPGGRKALGSVLKMIDEMTLKVSDPAVLRELRLDKATITELAERAAADVEED